MKTELSALVVAASAALALSGFTAQRPGTPGGTPPLLERWPPETPVSKSDADRIVGKVLEIDSTRGLVKLQTEEGVLVVKPAAQAVRAFVVGDTVSVPRAGAVQPSASPSQ